jgi:hypothetical protein
MKVLGFSFIACLSIVTQPLASTAQSVRAVAEVFTNTRCVNCYGPDDAYDAALALHPEYGVAQINYHNDIPYPQDPFYMDNTKGPRTRTYDLYKIQGNPWAMIDGISGTGSSDKWISNTKIYQNIPLPVTVTVDVKPNGTAFDIHLSAHGGTERMIAYVVLTESHLVYDNSAYHMPKNGYWDNVFRIMLPRSTGTNSFIAAQGKDTTITWDPATYPSDINPSNLKAIVIVQDASGVASGDGPVLNYQIEGAASAPFSSSGVAGDVSPGVGARLLLLHNPITAYGRIGFSLPSPSHVKLTLSDMLGREVRVLADGMMPEGQTSVEMNSASLPAGCYFARMVVAGVEVDRAKLVVE